jgi:hypothetical protein
MNPKHKQPKPPKPQLYKRNDLVVVKEGAELLNKPGEVLEEDHAGLVLGYSSKGHVFVTLLNGDNVIVEESYVEPNQDRSKQ